MVVCTVSIAAGTVLHILAGFAKAMPPTPVDDILAGFAKAAHLSWVCDGKGLELSRYIALLGLYVGFTVVCVGLVTMDQPAALGGEDVPVSDAANCVLSLTLQYFAVNLALQVSLTVGEFMNLPPRIVEIFEMAATTVYYCPMLSILFLAARMR